MIRNFGNILALFEPQQRYSLRRLKRMNPNSANEETILEQALTFASAEARAAYLHGACSDDGPLRARIESLIEAHEAAGGFLDDKPRVAAPASSTVNAGPGTVIGRYKLR